ncbi:MFS transporter [Brucella pseudogrignonensis]|uniref:MFS transporter n=1 Tax=Brucella pseudogrignonensis TaxID=419475 RepID=UPI003ED01489
MFDYARDNLRFLQHNLRWIGGGFLLTLFSSFGQTFFIGLSGNELRQIFGLSGGAFGGLYMLATLASAMTLPWLGRSLDLMPGWKVTAFSLPMLGFACILIAVAPNIAVLTLSLYLLRLFGQGMMSEIALTETGRWFVANRGRAMAFATTGFQVGTAILPAIVIVIVQMSGDWRFGWFASAATIFLIGLPVIVTLMRVERVPQARDAVTHNHSIARDWTRAEVIRDPVFYLLLVGTLAPGFIGTVIFFHQGYLIETRGYDPLAFAAAYAVMSVVTVVFSFVCGHLIDRFGALRLLPFFLLPLSVASAAVALIVPVWGVYVFMLLLGISNGFTSTLMGALWPEVYGIANLGGIRALTVSAMVFSTAAGPGLTGVLIDAGISLPVQMLFMSAWCVSACFVLSICARKIRCRAESV